MVPKITLDRSYLEQVQLDQTPLVRDRMYDIIYAALKVTQYKTHIIQIVVQGKSPSTVV